MAETAQVRTWLVGSAALIAASLGVGAYFARPAEHELPPMPLVHPGAPAAPAIGHAAPDRIEPRRRTDACGGAEQPMAVGPRPLTSPQGWFSGDDYPVAALAAGKTGVTTTDLVVDSHGLVIGCGVSGSSGHFTLDSQTCSIFRARARFAPAEDARGCPVASVWHKRVRWQIPPF